MIELGRPSFARPLPTLRRCARAGAILGLGLAIAGCSWLSPRDTRYDPVPLVPFTPEIQAGVVWSVPMGGGAGVGFAPQVVDSAVYAASADGQVAKIDLASGQVVWSARVDGRLQAGAGSDGITTAVITPQGEIIAFDDQGSERWRAKATSESLVPPAVGEGLVVVRSGDYRVQAFDADTGERRWSVQRPGPSLALRASNQMLIAGGFVFTGLPGGKLVAIDVDSGIVQWEGSVAIPRGASELERVADVVGRPLIMQNLLCAVAYQGRIACFDIAGGGDLVWARDFSSAAGMAADTSSAFAADARGVVNGFLLAGGANIWRNDALRHRELSAPATTGRVVAIGDYEGYVHVLAREDGRLLGRVRAGSRPILAPLVATPYGVVVQNSDGSVHLLNVGG
ncbi:MAG: outer membrane protein assembly factor BamB [Pigmentiphaga sp.]|nr:outer membrane protein assembly factor BamB [Pigmentiphaga sp.]